MSDIAMFAKEQKKSQHRKSLSIKSKKKNDALTAGLFGECVEDDDGSVCLFEDDANLSLLHLWRTAPRHPQLKEFWGRVALNTAYDIMALELLIEISIEPKKNISV